MDMMIDADGRKLRRLPDRSGGTEGNGKQCDNAAAPEHIARPWHRWFAPLETSGNSELEGYVSAVAKPTSVAALADIRARPLYEHPRCVEPPQCQNLNPRLRPLNSSFLTTYRAWNCKETGVAEARPESAAEDDYQERKNVAP